MVKIHLALPYEKRLLPFLLEPLGPPDELWMMGQSGDCAVCNCSPPAGLNSPQEREGDEQHHGP